MLNAMFFRLNGLFLFAPDTINKAMTHPSDKPVTICMLINKSENSVIIYTLTYINRLYYYKSHIQRVVKLESLHLYEIILESIL